MRIQWNLAVVALIGVSLLGCSKPAGESAASKLPAATADRHATVADDEDKGDGDPCSLLVATEVEAVLGESLGTPPFVDTDDSASRDQACRYVGNDLREVRVEVTWSGANMVWNMLGRLQGAINQQAKGMLKLADGSELSGEWDEARVQGCCQFMALRGDQIVAVDVAGSKAGIAQAARLVDAALKRIDQPPAVRGSEQAAAAAAFFRAHRPAPRGACELVGRTEAEELIGPLLEDPKPEGDKCRYSLPRFNHLDRFVELRYRWQEGYRTLRDSGALADRVAAGMGLGGSDHLSEEMARAVGPASWEAVHETIGEFSAVKRDVMISADTRTGKPGDAQKLIARAMSKL